MAHPRGFTLIELIVTVVIMMSFMGITAVAYPSIRTYAADRSTVQLIQSELRSLQQRAIHRERSTACLDDLESTRTPDAGDYNHCSELGLLFTQDSNEVAIIANSYIEDDEVSHLNINDIELSRFNLPDGVTAANNAVIAVTADPPTLHTLFAKDDAALTEIDSYAAIELTVHDESRTVYILPYGQVTSSEPAL